MKKAIMLALFGALATMPLASHVQAGTGAGNGGGAVVCRDPINNHQIFHVDLYDLWEGKVVYGLNIDPTPNEVTADQIVVRAIERLVAIHDLFGGDVANALKGVQIKIQEQLKETPKNVYLPDTNDSNRRLMPKYCPSRPEVRPEYEQVVNLHGRR